MVTGCREEVDMSDRDFNRGRRGWNRDEERPYESGERPSAGPYSMGDRYGDRYKVNRQSTDWMTPGPFTGVGPKGYRRKDERILDDINERLTRHGQVDASNISVEVSEGMVTLNGMVSSRREKHIAEYVAESVSGVQDVQNNLCVVRSESRQREWKAPGEVSGERSRDSESRQETRSAERSLADSSIPQTGADDTGTVSAGTVDSGEAGGTATIPNTGSLSTGTVETGAAAGPSTPSRVSGSVTGSGQRRGVHTYGVLGSNVPSTGEQSTGGAPGGGAQSGDTPSQFGSTGGTMREDGEMEKPDFRHETGTEPSAAESEPPAQLRGEGLTPPQGQARGEADLPSHQAPQFDVIRHEAPEMGEGAETTSQQQSRAGMEHSEPGSTHGPAAVAGGPTDIEEGSSGSTLGDREAMQEEQIPHTGGAFKGGAFGEPIDKGDQPDITIPGQTDFSTLLEPGMIVLGSDGQAVGTVKEVRYDDFLLNRPMARDIYVPFRACDRVDNDQLVLTVASDAITQQGWESPALF